jgi:RNA polymerase sigma factor (sigma-70 family)
MKRFPQLTVQEEEQYLNAIKTYRNKLIEGNLRLVVKSAFEVNQGWKDVDVLDLIQEGNLALTQAIDRFEIDKGYKLNTFVLYRIKGAMLDFIRDNTGPFKVGTTKAQREIFNNIGQIKDELRASGATIDEVAEDHGVEPADIALMTTVPVNIDDVEEHELVDHRTPESIYLKTEARTNLRRKMLEFRSTLNENEKFVWESRILEEQFTLDQCAEALKYNHPMKVKRLQDKVLAKAKNFFTSLDFIDIMET